MSALNITPKAAQQLLKAIEDDFALAQKLKAVLKEEKQHLEQRQYSAHQNLVKQKTQYLMELEQADVLRRQTMASMGLTSDRVGFETFVSQVPDAWKERFHASWEKLSDTMNTCARLNKVNGKILAHAQNSMDRLMSIIKGSTSNVSVYQSNGRKNLHADNRMLATA